MIKPTSGFLASGKIGKGRFPHTSLILKKIMAVAEGCKSLRGKKFLISGGRTEEDIDSLRVVTNRSTGRMARELLYAVACRDGQARAIFGEASVSLPKGMETIRTRTSEEMLQELKNNIAWCDCLIMAAAVGDYFGIPSHTDIPDIDDLDVNPMNPVEIEGDPNTTIRILVTDRTGRCPDYYQLAHDDWDVDTNVFTKLIR